MYSTLAVITVTANTGCLVLCYSNSQKLDCPFNLCSKTAQLIKLNAAKQRKRFQISRHPYNYRVLEEVVMKHDSILQAQCSNRLSD